MRAFRVFFALVAIPVLLTAAKTLDIYFIDVEGGQATLIVAPSGQSMLVDAGWRGYDGRDAKRISEAAKKAGVKKIDYLLVTHYHLDHVGGVPQLAELMPVTTFVDHGPNNEDSKGVKELFAAYEQVVSNGKRLVVKPGDQVPLKGVNVTMLSAAGNLIEKPVEGGGAANPLCGSDKPREGDPTENARSAGFLLTFGKFRFINLGDLTWNKEMDLVCPQNKAGEVDVYLTTHHGMNMSGPATIVHALKPRAAIMNNGAKKGGSPEAWDIVRKSPGLEDIWQLHFAIAGGEAHNSPQPFLANLHERCEGNWIKLSAQTDGSFTVFNSRNRYQKTYPAR